MSNQLADREIELEGEIHTLKVAVEELQERLRALHRELNLVQEERARAARADNIPITDHAVVRYMERVMGLDVDAVKDAIDNELKKHAEEIAYFRGNGTFPITGAKVVLKDFRIITVVP